MWVCLNTTRNELPAIRRRARRVGAANYLSYVRERTALFAGLADATISHDETWWYLVLGRSLERIDMTARLLEGRLLAGDDSPDWLTLLRAAGAMESFLRASVQVASPEEIAPSSCSIGPFLARPTTRWPWRASAWTNSLSSAAQTATCNQARLTFGSPRRGSSTWIRVPHCANSPRSSIFSSRPVRRRTTRSRALLSPRRGDQLGQRAGHMSDLMRLVFVT